MDRPNILQKIAEYKNQEVEHLRERTTSDELCQIAAAQPPVRPFRKAIAEAAKSGPALITEVKKASPSKGLIREDFHPVEIARAYEKGGATCLSVLTDAPSFQGSNQIFRDVRKASDLPMLRKDFMLDPIQIAESRAMGADCILIILAMVNDRVAKALMDEASALGMDSLVETHDEDEVRRAVDLGADLIGVNNRDLRTFETSLSTFGRLAPLVPDGTILIAESGIFTRDDISLLSGKGAHGFLIGESLMRQDDVALAVNALL